MPSQLIYVHQKPGEREEMQCCAIGRGMRRLLTQLKNIFDTSKDNFQVLNITLPLSFMCSLLLLLLSMSLLTGNRITSGKSGRIWP